ncbi:hypothetical protein GJ496_009631 [Pomphorhynchus laevis]|nr:hypothetical protein GJ496_009631 [Pomphorhynchus laevis]
MRQVHRFLHRLYFVAEIVSNKKSVIDTFETLVSETNQNELKEIMYWPFLLEDFVKRYSSQCPSIINIIERETDNDFYDIPLQRITGLMMISRKYLYLILEMNISKLHDFLYKINTIEKSNRLLKNFSRNFSSWSIIDVKFMENNSELDINIEEAGKSLIKKAIIISKIKNQLNKEGETNVKVFEDRQILLSLLPTEGEIEFMTKSNSLLNIKEFIKLNDKYIEFGQMIKVKVNCQERWNNKLLVEIEERLKDQLNGCDLNQ